MQGTISGNDVKFLGRSIYSLARIGEDVYIETTDNGILLQGVNSARSAYASFTFESPFFIKFKKEGNCMKFKVSLKSWLMAFQCLSTLEKIVAECLIDTTSVPNSVVLKFAHKNAMRKVCYMPFIENETVQAEFPNNIYQCKFTAQSRLLSDGIQNFSSTVDEVTLTVSFDRLTFKNYVDDEPDPSKIVHTELTLEADEFDDYEVSEETEVTFCLKELKAFLCFFDGSDVPVTIYCQGAGKPIMFSAQIMSGAKSEFVLATLTGTVSSQISGISVEQNSVPKASSHNAKKEGSKRKPGSKSEIRKATVASGGSFPEVPLRDPENSNPAHATVSKTSECASLQATNDEVFLSKGGNSDIFEAIHVRKNNIPENDGRSENTDANDGTSGNVEVCEEQGDVIPSTPPAKKLFQALNQTIECSWPPNSDEVLVPDSDEDKDGYD